MGRWRAEFIMHDRGQGGKSQSCLAGFKARALKTRKPLRPNSKLLGHLPTKKQSEILHLADNAIFQRVQAHV